ncbi:hypothetical protein A3D14_01280 [Candidatus Saccharibacteria bacterium RIFCSPHIGHO2_02_FULL_47_12]|nr:MAG: hypothetical protein A3D14_01280 [Candidatus Saccharibacteria bacterium RIFCSPHIGHO2_02_FULL_47_12]
MYSLALPNLKHTVFVRKSWRSVVKKGLAISNFRAKSYIYIQLSAVLSELIYWFQIDKWPRLSVVLQY